MNTEFFVDARINKYGVRYKITRTKGKHEYHVYGKWHNWTDHKELDQVFLSLKNARAVASNLSFDLLTM